MESFILLHMPVYIYIYIYIYIYVIYNLGVHGRFYGLDLKKGNICLALEIARLVNDEENNCRFEFHREEHGIHIRPTWSIAVREMLLELFFVTKLAYTSICSGIECNTSSWWWLGTIFNLSEVRS